MSMLGVIIGCAIMVAITGLIGWGIGAYLSGKYSFENGKMQKRD